MHFYLFAHSFQPMHSYSFRPCIPIHSSSFVHIEGGDGDSVRVRARLARRDARESDARARSARDGALRLGVGAQRRRRCSGSRRAAHRRRGERLDSDAASARAVRRALLAVVRLAPPAHPARAALRGRPPRDAVPPGLLRHAHRWRVDVSVLASDGVRRSPASCVVLCRQRALRARRRRRDVGGAGALSRRGAVRRRERGGSGSSTRGERRAAWRRR